MSARYLKQPQKDLLRYVIPPTVNRVSLLEGPVEAKFVCAYFCTYRRDMPSFSSGETLEVTQNRLLLKSPFLSKNRVFYRKCFQLMNSYDGLNNHNGTASIQKLCIILPHSATQTRLKPSLAIPPTTHPTLHMTMD